MPGRNTPAYSYPHPQTRRQKAEMHLAPHRDACSCGKKKQRRAVKQALNPIQCSKSSLQSSGVTVFGSFLYSSLLHKFKHKTPSLIIAYLDACNLCISKHGGINEHTLQPKSVNLRCEITVLSVARIQFILTHIYEAAFLWLTRLILVSLCMPSTHESALIFHINFNKAFTDGTLSCK